MTWWQWLLASVAAYFAIAGAVMAGMSYVEGVKASDADAGLELDVKDMLICGLLWPVAAIIDGVPNMLEALFEFGRNRANRKLNRQSKKNQDQAFRQLCAENGWNYRKMKAAQVTK